MENELELREVKWVARGSEARGGNEKIIAVSQVRDDFNESLVL